MNIFKSLKRLGKINKSDEEKKEDLRNYVIAKDVLKIFDGGYNNYGKK